MSLNTDVNSALLANKAKRDAANAPAGAPATNGQTPPANTDPTQSSQLTNQIPAPTKETPVAETVVKPEQAVPTKEKQPTEDVTTKEKPKETSPTEESAAETAVEEFKWDADIPDSEAPATESSPQPDFKKLGSALNIEAKTEEEFVSTVNEKLTKLKELDSLPEPLKQAIDVAKKGGDWVALTGAVAFDAKSLDPIELFEKEYERANIDRFKAPDGTIDWAKFDEEVDAIAPGLKKMQGNVIKNALVQRQEQQKNAILAQTAAQQDKFQRSLGDAAKELPNLLPKDQFGITIEPKHSAYLYNGIASGALIKKHFGDIDPSVLSKMDGKKLMKTLAIAEFGEQISQFQYKQGEVAGKKALLAGTQNAQTQSPSHLPKPEEPVTQQVTSADRLRKMNENSRPVNSL